jgi:putative ABC transport system permease protein
LLPLLIRSRNGSGNSASASLSALPPASICRLVVTQGVTLAAFGVLVGTSAGWAMSRGMATLLPESVRNDPSVYAAVAVLMLLVAVAASALPARRAARADVIQLLRRE